MQGNDEMKKYLLLSGQLSSYNGEDFHYISAKKLQELYNLPINECILANNESDLNGINFDNLIILRPRYNGDYNEYLEEVINASF